jgi:hypothetical protein
MDYHFDRQQQVEYGNKKEGVKLHYNSVTAMVVAVGVSSHGL